MPAMHIYINDSTTGYCILYISTCLLSLRLECLVISWVVSKFCTACVALVRSPLSLEFVGDTAGLDEDGVDNAPAIIAKARTISDWELPPVATLNNTRTSLVSSTRDYQYTQA